MSYVTCDKCDGKGVVECPTCNGAFAHSVKQTTNEIFGLEDDEECPNCHNEWVVTCDECGGTGKVEEDDD